MNTLYNILSTTSETNAAFELKLYAFLQEYEKHRISSDALHKLESLIDGIYNTEPNINTITEELIGQTLQIDDYDLQRLYLELVYYIVGKRHAEDSQNVTIHKLDKWGDCVMQHGFYLGFDLTRNDVERLINDIQAIPSYIANNSRDINLRYSEFANYYQTDFNNYQTDDELIKKISPYNDGAYTELPESISVILLYCQKHQWYDLWLKIYDFLMYVPLQGAMVYGISMIEDILGIIRAVNGSTATIKHSKVLSYLLNRRAFTLILNQEDLLERQTHNEQLDTNLIECAKEFLAEWYSHKQANIEECVFANLMHSFSPEEIITWMSRMYDMASNKRGHYRDCEIRLLNEYYKIIQHNTDITTVQIDNFNLHALLYYVSHVEIERLSKEKCEALIRDICQHLYTDERMYLTWGFDNESFAQMRAVYACLNKSGMNGIDMAKEQVALYDKSTLETQIQIQSAHKYWLAILILKVEDSETALNDFAEVEQFIFETTNTMAKGGRQEYLLPLLIGEAVAMELVKDYDKDGRRLKDEYEANIIKNVDNILLKLTILSLNEGDLNESNKEKIQDQIQKEWDNAKSLNPRNPNINRCEEYIGILNRE